MRLNRSLDKFVKELEAEGVPGHYTRRNMRRVIWASLWHILSIPDIRATLKVEFRRIIAEEAVMFDIWEKSAEDRTPADKSLVVASQRTFEGLSTSLHPPKKDEGQIMTG